MSVPCVALPSSDPNSVSQQALIAEVTKKIDNLIDAKLIIPENESGLSLVAEDNSRFSVRKMLIDLVSCGNKDVNLNKSGVLKLLDQLEKLKKPLADTGATELFAKNLNYALWLDYHRNKSEMDYLPTLNRMSDNSSSKITGKSSTELLDSVKELSYLIPFLGPNRVNDAKSARDQQLAQTSKIGGEKFSELSATFSYSNRLINAESKFQNILSDSSKMSRVTARLSLPVNGESAQLAQKNRNPEVGHLAAGMGALGAASMGTVAAAGGTAWVAYQASAKVTDRIYQAEQTSLMGDVDSAGVAKMRLSFAVGAEIKSVSGKLKGYMDERYKTAANLRVNIGTNTGIRAANQIRSSGETTIAQTGNPEIAAMAKVQENLLGLTNGIQQLQNQIGATTPGSAKRAELEKQLKLLQRQKELAERGTGALRGQTSTTPRGGDSVFKPREETKGGSDSVFKKRQP
jgi:hypothetical protein